MPEEPSGQIPPTDVDKVVNLTDKARQVVEKPIDFNTLRCERVADRATALLQAEGLPQQEIAQPTPDQMLAMISHSLNMMTIRRESDGRAVNKSWEPEIVSVRVNVVNSWNQKLLDETDPYQLALGMKTFRGEAGNVTQVRISYSPEGEDDNKIFTDTYRLDDATEGSAPHPTDINRYEGRRIFPEVKSLLEKIGEGNVDDSLADLPNIREGRRTYVFQALDEGLSDAESDEAVRNVYRFLIRGATTHTFSADQLAWVLSWPLSNNMRLSSDWRCEILKRMPEYQEALGVIKSLVVPADEEGSNITTDGIEALPWIVTPGSITDEEFQKIAGTLTKLISQPQQDNPRRTDALLEVLPYLTLNAAQRKIALETLNIVVSTLPYESDAKTARKGIEYLTSQQLLETINFPENPGDENKPT